MRARSIISHAATVLFDLENSRSRRKMGKLEKCERATSRIATDCCWCPVSAILWLLFPSYDFLEFTVFSTRFFFQQRHTNVWKNEKNIYPKLFRRNEVFFTNSIVYFLLYFDFTWIFLHTNKWNTIKYKQKKDEQWLLLDFKHIPVVYAICIFDCFCFTVPLICGKREQMKILWPGFSARQRRLITSFYADTRQNTNLFLPWCAHAPVFEVREAEQRERFALAKSCCVNNRLWAGKSDGALSVATVFPSIPAIHRMPNQTERKRDEIRKFSVFSFITGRFPSPYKFNIALACTLPRAVVFSATAVMWSCTVNIYIKYNKKTIYCLYLTGNLKKPRAILNISTTAIYSLWILWIF